jgi:hypothetical protein
VAAAFDAQEDRRELVLAAFLPRGRTIDCRTCANHVAEAIGEPIVTLNCYDESSE